MKLLLIEADKILARSLSENLSKQNFVVDRVADVETGWYYVANFPYDLILLDQLSLNSEGIGFCQRLRQRGHNSAIILLTNYNGSSETIKGLNAGADDYLVKPFDFEELIARIRAVLRRDNQTLSPRLEWGELSLDPVTCQVSYQDRILNLTAKQYALLELFLRHQGRVFSHGEIIDKLWSSEAVPGEESVRTHIKELRQKLKAAGLAKDTIATIYGQGYSLKPKPIVISQPIKLTQTKDFQNIAALRKIWEEYKPVFIERLAVFEQVKDNLARGTLNPQLQAEAQLLARSLAATLGSFGKQRGAELALELEQLLQLEQSLAQTREKEFLRLLSSMQMEIEQSIKLENSPLLSTVQEQHQDCPALNLLIIDSNSQLIRSLSDTARGRGIKILTAPTVQATRAILSQKQVDAVLLKLCCSHNWDLEEGLSALEQVRDFAPTLPLFVISDRGDFSARLEVIRRGGDTFLEQPVTPGFIVDTIQTQLNRNRLGAKIMIVDDERFSLDYLSSCLLPWGFEITTIEDPTQFWQVLVKVNPDLLILDLEMPQVNGIDLCSIVRSAPSWIHLPILFLTVDREPQTRDLIFTVGADDVIYKPVVADELAHRIINRLNRNCLTTAAKTKLP